MARGVNRVTLIGNLGRDPEIKHANSGATIANFSVAVNESWKDKQTGEQQEKTEWVNCVAFSRLAEIIEQYLLKGQQVYIEGKLQTRSWEADGVKKYMTEVLVNEMQMLGGKGDGGQQRPAQAQGFRDQPRPAGDGTTQNPTYPAQRPAAEYPTQAEAFTDDDIPF